MEKIIKNKFNKLKIVLKVLMIIIGVFIIVYGLEVVLILNNVLDGGVIGLSIVSLRLFGLLLGVLIVVINIFFVWLGYK